MLGFSANAEGNSTNGLPTMRLAGEDAQLVTPHQRNPRKRKSPPESAPEQPQQQQQPPPPPPQIHHVLPPMIHPMQGHPLPPGYPYADFTPGGMPPQHPPDQQSQSPAASSAAAGRALSNSKRAEQNRKAQRAFRERRDQHVKALESRSQLLDAALASADEANRRWEECRALVDQLRIENAALRAALQQAQTLPPGIPPPPAQPNPPQPQNGLSNHDPGTAAQQQLEEATRSLEAVVNDSLKSESAEPTESKSEQA